MNITTLHGIRSEIIQTKRIRSRVLFSGDDKGIPVLFLHGNLSCATFWEETMLLLPSAFRGIAVDLRGYGASDVNAKTDATRGVDDYVDDILAILDYLSIEKTYITAHSFGALIVWEMLCRYPERFIKAIMVSPGSPFGYGGTKDKKGTPCYDDFAGSGAGLFPQAVADSIIKKDKSLDDAISPLSILRRLIVKPPFISEREDILLDAILATHIGEKDIPGDFNKSENWPYFSPGIWGQTNAASPKYLKPIDRLYNINKKIDILLIRGTDDLSSANDRASSCCGTLGSNGLIPDWPGEDVFPPQPMLSQTKYVLENYKKNGGKYFEVVIPDCGHLPYLEKPDIFNKALHDFLKK